MPQRAHASQSTVGTARPYSSLVSFHPLCPEAAVPLLNTEPLAGRASHLLEGWFRARGCSSRKRGDAPVPSLTGPWGPGVHVGSQEGRQGCPSHHCLWPHCQRGEESYETGHHGEASGVAGWAGEQGERPGLAPRLLRPASLPLLFDSAAFSALADNHISHNPSLGYLGGLESKPAYPAPPQVTPARYSPVPRHMIGDEDFTR